MISPVYYDIYIYPYDSIHDISYIMDIYSGTGIDMWMRKKTDEIPWNEISETLTGAEVQ